RAVFSWESNSLFKEMRDRRRGGMRISVFMLCYNITTTRPMTQGRTSFYWRGVVLRRRLCAPTPNWGCWRYPVLGTVCNCWSRGRLMTWRADLPDLPEAQYALRI